MTFQLDLQPRQSERTCPWCHDDVPIDGVTCPGCAAEYHVECVEEAQVCGVTGCRRPLPGLQPTARREIGAAQRGPAVVGIRQPEPVRLDRHTVERWLTFLGEASLVLFLLAVAVSCLAGSWASFAGEVGTGMPAIGVGVPLLLIGLISLYAALSWGYAKVSG